METSFIYVAIFGSFLVIALAVKVLTASWFKEVLPRLVRPLILLLAALIIFTVGYGGVRMAKPQAAEGTEESTVPVEEG
ncbi:MAG: hypothetical protein ACK2T3_13570, partial [Candidatus Promineifilaceae bacterium]